MPVSQARKVNEALEKKLDIKREQRLLLELPTRGLCVTPISPLPPPWGFFLTLSLSLSFVPVYNFFMLIGEYWRKGRGWIMRRLSRFCLVGDFACFASRALEREIFITGVFLAFLRFESKFRKFPFDRIR